jgi:FkbM family methyltransferase
VNFLKKIIKSTIHHAGFDICRLIPDSNPYFQILKGFQAFNIDIVLDVGANIGQFATELRLMGYKGDIVSFEPLSNAHAELSKIAARDPKWFVHPRGAIGDHEGETEINISGTSVASSILPMLEACSSAIDGLAYTGIEKTPIFKLDSIVLDYIKPYQRPFLKIDVQGYEWQVLDGAAEVLCHMQGVMCEVSLVALYKDQRLWMDIIQRLESEGFTVWAIQRGFTDPRDGRTLQLDVLFFRQS